MPSILLVTNDFGPRAGGIETFVVGLLERVPDGKFSSTPQLSPRVRSMTVAGCRTMA